VWVPLSCCKYVDINCSVKPLRMADTTSPAGKMVLTVFAGIAEFERALIQQRTSAGRIAARQRGVRFGRPPKLTPEQVALGWRLVAEGTSAREVARAILKCHPATFYRALGRLAPPSEVGEGIMVAG
jgi:DNA invertase Pin-like site-specific DNA recombinase